MKIVILGTAWPYRGGLAVYNERLAREFTAQGDVSVIPVPGQDTILNRTCTYGY